MDRKIIGNLEQYDRKNKDNLQKVFGIFANEEFGEKVSEIFKYDLQTLIRSNRPQVRVLMESGNGDDKWGTVGVSPDIIEASWQALGDACRYMLMKDANGQK